MKTEWEQVEELLEGGSPAAVSLDEDRTVILTADPSTDTLSVSFPKDPSEPLPASRFLNVETLDLPNGQLVRVTNKEPGLHREFLEIALGALRSEADNYAQGFSEQLARFRRILRRPVTPELDEEAGLVGELLFLALLADTLGPSAVDHWTGPDRDDHDFRLAAADVEIKTTVGNTRSHWVSIGSQLLPAPGRRLFLVSYHLKQVEAAEGAFSVRSLVDLVASRAGIHPGRLEPHLGEWAPAVGDRAERHFIHRADPRLIEVGSDLSAVSPEVVRAAFDTLADRVNELHARIDFSAMGTDDLSAALSGGRSS